MNGMPTPGTACRACGAPDHPSGCAADLPYLMRTIRHATLDEVMEMQRQENRAKAERAAARMRHHTKLTRWAWLFRFLCRPSMKRVVSQANYYRLLDLLTDNNGWRPLSMREAKR